MIRKKPTDTLSLSSAEGWTLCFGAEIFFSLHMFNFSCTQPNVVQFQRTLDTRISNKFSEFIHSKDTLGLCFPDIPQDERFTSRNSTLNKQKLHWVQHFATKEESLLSQLCVTVSNEELRQSKEQTESEQGAGTLTSLMFSLRQNGVDLLSRSYIKYIENIPYRVVDVKRRNVWSHKLIFFFFLQKKPF